MSLTQFPLAVHYALDTFFTEAAFPDAPQYELDLIFNEQYPLPANESELTRFTDDELNLAATEKRFDDEIANELSASESEKNEIKVIKMLKIKRSMSCSLESFEKSSVQRVSLMKRCVSAVEVKC